MKFEARALKVQLPCKAITVIDADEYDARLQAHKYWQVVAWENGARFRLPDRCEECSANPSEPLCQNTSEDIGLPSFDPRVLPILRRQLEARLADLAKVEAAVAKAGGGR
jgi:hypothetical protein